ncbi:MAG TPA: hypothetical protein PK014_04050 [Thermoanaerobaculia bacterium]|nr:hypothetical protein [Thermoanaerobaculia bacterium]HUM29229.1 hypothetical protein [Thermoanaerobaculia bacterium]HXK67812.1 hypothetical protein [Thermoanaerobaculia bacterium]
MNPGLIGGIIGCVIGVIGGLIGTYASIRNTLGPKERAFAIRASIIGWIAAIIFLVLLFVLPSPWRYFLWVPYSILLPLGILYWNRTQQRIREEEAGNV